MISDQVNDHTRERSILEHPSRRNFLGMSSVALATAALSGLTANAQQRSSTEKAEKDHSSSDPGPENKSLLALNPNSNMPPATDHGDLVPLWYSFDLVKKRVEEGGWTHEVTERVLPSSKDVAGVNMRLTAGSYREMHWHTADEWAYVLYGHARVTVMHPETGKIFINDVSEGDLWIFPAGFPHSIQGLGPDGTEFLLVFPQGGFSEDGTMLLSAWMAHTPPEVLAKNTGLPLSTINAFPRKPLYIFPGQVPPSLEADKADIGLANISDSQFTYSLKGAQPNKSTKGGDVRIVDPNVFPLSTHIVGALVTLKPGGMRELHWHPHASEWQFWIAGKGRMTVFFPVDNARTVDFNANDVGYIPSNAPHYVENTGDTDCVFLELFASDRFMDVSLNQWLRRVPSEMLKAHLGIDKELAAKIPQEKLEVI
jgi:oxalate decarboxylase